MPLPITPPEFNTSHDASPSDTKVSPEHSAGLNKTGPAVDNEEILKDLTATFIETLINDKAPECDFLRAHMASRMVTVGAHTRHVCRSRDDLLDQIRGHSLTNPMYHLDIYREAISSELDEARGFGTVFISASVRGFLRGEEDARLGREWFGKLEWRWWGARGRGMVGVEGEGRWVCIRMAGMIGCPWLIGVS